MDLSIIIVNWNSKDYLKDCIESILATVIGLNYEIIVIDGGSFDGCDKMILEFYPEVVFIQSSKNVGFAKANNRAFRKSKGKNILFLNPDTVVKGNAIEELYHCLENLKAAGIVGPKLLNSDNSIQMSSVRVFPNLLNQILDADILMRIFPGSKLWAVTPLFNQSKNPSEVEAVSGACLMIKKQVFEKVGLFSEDYFMYAEDFDLCYKIKEAHLKSYHIPNAVVVHYGGQSSSKAETNTFSDVMMLESKWLFFKKTRSKSYCQKYRISMFFSSLFRILIVLLLWPIFIILNNSPLIEYSIKKSAARLRWSMGLESWVKDFNNINRSLG